MNNLSRKERHLILISILLSTAGLLFQNCSKKLASQSLLSAQTSVTDTTPVFPDGGPQQDPVKEEANSKTLSCSIPNVRFTSLKQTCLPKALERMGRIGPLDNFTQFQPKYPLYSDGAGKRRWIYLPAGTQIDSSNLDHWIYPKGTIVFKEFSMDGQAIETRMIEKILDGDGADAWRFSLFAHRKDGTDADRLDNADLHLQTDLLATYKASEFSSRYNIGSTNTCTNCHGRTNDVVRGFSYLQLSQSSLLVNIDTVKAKNWLTAPPVRYDEIPGNATHQAAVGYIQSNCATCHDGTAKVGPGDFRHLSTSTSYLNEPLYATQIARPGIINPGAAETSRLYMRLSSGSMPKIPLFNKDSANISVIQGWINQLQ